MKTETSGMLVCGKCNCPRYFVYQDPKVAKVWIVCSECGNESEIVRIG